MQQRDIIAIGGSAGALQGLRAIVRQLPADLPAAVFVTLHMGESSYLPELLESAGPLPAALARPGDPIQPGRIYVATPDRHLVLHDHHVLVSRGPRENLARPSIDVMFRSAAVSFGGRVVGVLLSGLLNDGTAGLAAIRTCGGLCIVQDPHEAPCPDMPASAMRHGLADHKLTAEAIGALLGDIADEPAAETPQIPSNLRLETAIAAQELSDMSIDEQLGSLSALTCPECSGALWEIDDSTTLRYRCHTGHAFTAEVAQAAQAEEYDTLLNKMLRASHERAALARRIAEKDRARGDRRSADHMEKRARDYDEEAELARRLLTRT